MVALRGQGAANPTTQHIKKNMENDSQINMCFVDLEAFDCIPQGILLGML